MGVLPLPCRLLLVGVQLRAARLLFARDLGSALGMFPLRPQLLVGGLALDGGLAGCGGLLGSVALVLDLQVALARDEVGLLPFFGCLGLALSRLLSGVRLLLVELAFPLHLLVVQDGPGVLLGLALQPVDESASARVVSSHRYSLVLVPDRRGGAACLVSSGYPDRGQRETS